MFVQGSQYILFVFEVAFAMTINKSQGMYIILFFVCYEKFSGQTLKYVGLWLRSEPFTHGQLYVALSRVGKPERLKFAVRCKDKSDLPKELQNVVFKEILL